MLGGGGLVRAYSHGCKIAVDAARIMYMCDCYELTVTTDYNLYGKINHIFPEFEVKIISSEFTDEVTINLVVKTEICDNFVNELIDITNNKIKIMKSEQKFADFA